mgnify:CR=1 FL=1
MNADPIAWMGRQQTGWPPVASACPIQMLEWKQKGWIIEPLYAAPVTAAPVDAEELARNRYRPVPDGLIAYRVVAGDGTRSLFSGTKDACNIVARKLTEAFLDGAYVASTPAAPGIDLEPFREAVEAQYSAGMEQWCGGAEEKQYLTEHRDRLLALIDVSPKGAVHPDDLAVDAFAAAMKAKLAEARAKGRGGWNGDEPGMQQRLSNMLRDHIEKGDPRDVANFCMFLHQRGEGISPMGGSDERTRFEAWAKPNLYDMARYEEDPSSYLDKNTRQAWDVWQAATQATSAEVGECNCANGRAECMPDCASRKPTSHGAGVSNG